MVSDPKTSPNHFIGKLIQAFFVAKVNLKEQEKTGLSYLRPLQFAFNLKKFINEIRKKMKEDWRKGLWEKKGDKVLNNSKDKKKNFKREERKLVESSLEQEKIKESSKLKQKNLVINTL